MEIEGHVIISLGTLIAKLRGSFPTGFALHEQDLFGIALYVQ